MAHLIREEILRACEGGWAEVARIATHLATCRACRALAAGILGDRTLSAKRPRILKILGELASFENEMAAKRLLAKAELAGLRRLRWGAQKERVILSRLCHTPAFLDAILDALRAQRPREESESLANLALLAVQGLAGNEAFKNDLLAMIWIETANARRIRGEWQPARAALLRAEEHGDAGTGDSGIRARWLSIAGSFQRDQGSSDEAMASLEECQKTYADRGEWPLVGRTLLTMAHCVADDEPERALILLDRASTYIPLGDTSLRCHAEQIRTDCMVTVGRLDDALRAFAEAERLRSPHDRPSLALRSGFFAARLLESLGQAPAAAVLFDAVVAEELDRGHFKDAVLDLVYIFGFYLRLGSTDRAADLGLRAVGELDRRDSTQNEQLRSVLAQLVDAARGQCLDEEMLRAARERLRMQWSRPAPAEPKPASDGQPQLRSASRVEPPLERTLVEPLLARAQWCGLQGETRREQHARVARSPEYCTAAFVELLLTEIRQTRSRDAAEFTASLALLAIEPMAAPSHLKHDLQARLWTEVANIRRIASEWSKAEAALLRAGKHLLQGSGGPLLKARAQSIAASLSTDQGRRAEALTALEECQELYESQGAWALVARTKVQMANALMDTDPARALRLAEQALPVMSAEDIALRCHAENIRTDCLISLGEIGRALQAFDDAEPFRSAAVSPVARRRSDFFAARLLEHLDHSKEAVQLFEAVIADAFDHEAHREAFLDLLYLVGVHIRRGATEEAVALCHRAIDRLDFFGLGHEQLRTVWTELRDAAMRQSISHETLAEVREFLKAHWTTPAAKPPSFALK
jgi:tetratricopeptide (TPR) repeat protein